MTTLTPVQRRALRAAAHHLDPVVSISQKGLADSVLAEIDRCLKAHELIKLRLYGVERESRTALVTEICTRLGCADVQQIGNLLVLWRERPAEAAAAKSTPAARRRAVPRTKKQAAAANERRRTRRPA